MMALRPLPARPEWMETLPVDLMAFQPNRNAETAEQIANHLEGMLIAYGDGNPLSLRLPSTLALADFYHATVLDVLEALFLLKRRHYEYVMHGLDVPVTLHDPMGRIRKPAGCGAAAGFWAAFTKLLRI